MKSKTLILGVILILAGMVARLVPHVNTGLTVFTILEILGIILVFIVIVRRWKDIGRWVRARAWGRQVRFLIGFLLLAVCFQCAWAVYDEIEGGKRFKDIERDLESKTPDAALALAARLGHEDNAENAPLRLRLVERIGELGRPTHSAFEVTSVLFRCMKVDEDDGVREAAAKALPAQMVRKDLVRIVVDMPGLDETGRSLASGALETFTGKVFGEDVGRWRDWLGTTWGGAEGDEAHEMAALAWEKSEALPALREASLVRLSDGRGVSEKRLLDTARAESPALRAAGASAIGSAGAKGLLSELVKILMGEDEASPAAAQAGAIAELDPPRSWLLLLMDVAGKDDLGDVCRAAARNAVADSLGTATGMDMETYMARVYRKLPKGKPKEDFFKALLRRADASAPARRELAIMFGDPKIKPWDRIRALKKLLATEGSLISDEALREVAKEDTDPELIKFAKEELDRR